MNRISRIVLAAILVGVSLGWLTGCTSYSVQSADGKSTLTDSAPWDSVVAISSGPGCQVPNPYIAPAPPPTPPTIVTPAKVCDVNGGNCQQMFMAQRAAVDPATICDTTVEQTKGIGMAGWLGGIGTIAASIALLVGTGGI